MERLKKYCSHAERAFLVPGRGSAFGEALAKEPIKSTLAFRTPWRAEASERRRAHSALRIQMHCALETRYNRYIVVHQ